MMLNFKCAQESKKKLYSFLSFWTKYNQNIGIEHFKDKYNKATSY